MTSTLQNTLDAKCFGLEMGPKTLSQNRKVSPHTEQYSRVFHVSHGLYGLDFLKILTFSKPVAINVQAISLIRETIFFLLFRTRKSIVI